MLTVNKFLRRLGVWRCDWLHRGRGLQRTYGDEGLWIEYCPRCTVIHRIGRDEF
jgi:hypothetical protein